MTAREQVLVTYMQEVPFCCSPSQRGHSACSVCIALCLPSPLFWLGKDLFSRWSVRLVVDLGAIVGTV